jgi:hypothetical protein
MTGEAELQVPGQRDPGAVRQQSRSVARRAQSHLANSGTSVATASSNDRCPLAANHAITVATMGFVSDPALNRVCGVTGRPVLTSASPAQATVTAPLRRIAIDAPGTPCRPTWSCSSSASWVHSMIVSSW